MKAYMIYNRIDGPHECAILVFANNIKEAKKIAWRQSSVISSIVDNYFDMGIQWIKNSPYLFKEMIKKEPHCIDSPLTCKICNCWGNGEINTDGICESCYRDVLMTEEKNE